MTATVQSPDGQLQSPNGQLTTERKPKRPADPRYLALRNFAISISVFNIFGYTLLGFEQPWLWPFLAVGAAYTTEIVFELVSSWAYQRRPRFLGNGPRGVYEFLLPAHITALAVNMLLYVNNQFWPVLFGVILVSGTVINTRLTKRVALIVGWTGGFAIQAFVRHWLWGVQLNTALSVMTGIAFVLFTNYMITDPGTTPTRPRAQFMFGSSVALVYAILMELNIVYTLFFATSIVCACRGLGWWVAYLRTRRRQRRAAPAAAMMAARTGEERTVTA